jgi:hypothetical protein
MALKPSKRLKWLKVEFTGKKLVGFGRIGCGLEWWSDGVMGAMVDPAGPPEAGKRRVKVHGT